MNQINVSALSQDELVAFTLQAMHHLDAHDPAIDKLAAFLYDPAPRIAEYVKKVKRYLKKKNPSRADAQKMGYDLEEMALLAFGSLRGWTEIMSWESAGPQIDLEVVGSDVDWGWLAKYLLMPSALALMVESKATKDPVGDPEFARLAAIIDHNCRKTVGLGVFFTLNGASGFPERGKVKKLMGDAWLRQALFHARTGLPIVVLDQDDLVELGKAGSLVRLLRGKIMDLERLGGLSTAPAVAAKREDLPARLRALMPIR